MLKLYKLLQNELMKPRLLYKRGITELHNLIKHEIVSFVNDSSEKGISQIFFLGISQCSQIINKDLHESRDEACLYSSSLLYICYTN